MLSKKMSPKSDFNIPKTIFIKVLLPAPFDFLTSLTFLPYLNEYLIFLNNSFIKRFRYIFSNEHTGLDLNFIILNFFKLFIQLLSFLQLYSSNIETLKYFVSKS